MPARLVHEMPIHWLPYRRITLYSPLTPVEATQALSKHLTKFRSLRLWPLPLGTLEGTVSVDGFKFRQVVSGRSRVSSYINGSFIGQDGGTAIIVIFNEPIGTLLFLAWLAFIVVKVLPNLWIIYAIMLPVNALCLVALFLIVVPYYYIMRGFNAEASRTIQFLQDVFESQEMSST